MWLLVWCSRSRALAVGVCVEDPMGDAEAVCAVVGMLPVPVTTAAVIVVTADEVGPSRAPIV